MMSIFVQKKKVYRLFILLFGLITGCLAAQKSVCAWGPDDRPTYTNETQPGFAVFNSITDNAAMGDERNFVRVREANTADSYTDELEVVPGKEYEVFIYYRNDAAYDTNPTGYGVAADVRIASAYPAVINPGESGMVSGMLYWSYVTPDDAENARDGSVWDEAYLTTGTPNTVLRYKTGTAVIHNGGETDQSVLSTNIFTEDGTYIGYNKLTGIVPGGLEYSGYITYTLVAGTDAGANPGNEAAAAILIKNICRAAAAISGRLWYFLARQ